ncbi:hypothetical protein NPIL_587461, partial [Nephila pilipes]
EVVPEDKVERNIEISGSNYTLQQVDFHWGCEGKPGSEHKINNKQYDLE